MQLLPGKQSGWRHALPSSILVVLALAFVVGCTPMHHGIAPYDRDPLLAQEIETRANAICADVRGPDALPPNPFTTDGCSLWPDSDWRPCCIEHDIDYWCGGSPLDRCAADRRLHDCLAAADHPIVGSLMHLGVRIGGHPWWPFPWRWGYGWEWPYRYDDADGRKPLRGDDKGCLPPATTATVPN